ncbi:DUF411 domain-containing protein [Devosia sp.]|uniref:DUF411 domain-containing protein n=1 Tax=Devosia sp. TaxID=1871048 RepID=UPI0025C131E7|nr:DUF411 domain-containing protein [Devosia sp.]
MNKSLIVAAAVFALAAGAAMAAQTTPQDKAQAAAGISVASAAPSKEITIWRDPGCGCCNTYAEYLQKHGYDVTLVDDADFAQRSVAAGVPEQGLGCHLAQIDGYYVSGLVPVDIIERLVAERPDIAGITLPGMPANAPGMAPDKTGILKTYAFGDSGISVYSNE